MERTDWPAGAPHEPAADERIDEGRVRFVEPERGRGPKNYQRSDESINEDVSERLLHSAHLDCSDVTICVRDGNVSVEGTVPERWMKHAIENIAITVRGVVDVDNRIRVPRPSR
jgi:osmotically-inducible protein OsmY